MEEKGIKQIKKLIADFGLLATRFKKIINQSLKIKTKTKNQVLEAYKKEYQKLHHENETLKKSLANNKRN